MASGAAARVSRELIREFTARGYWGRKGYVARLKEHARKRPDAEAIVDSRRRVSFGEFAAIANRLAKGLLDLGVKQGDVVGLQLPNIAEFHFVRYALSAIGAITLPIAVAYRETELLHALSTTSAVAIVVPGSFHGCAHGKMLKDLQATLPALKLILVSGAGGPEGTISLDGLTARRIGEASALDYLDEAQSDPDAVDLLLLSSGTTGLSKIVMATPNAWLHTGSMTSRTLRATADDVVLALPPITGGAGYNNCLGAPIVSGARVVLQDGFDAADAVALLFREKVSLVAAVPTQAIKMVEALEREPASRLRQASVRAWISVGAYLPIVVAQKLEALLGCRVVNIFGAVEASVISANALDDPAESRHTTVGRLVEGTELKLMSEDGRVVAAGEAGEMYTRQPGMAVGYYGDPEGSGRVFGADGWVRTGDYAILDEQRMLRIQGRKKDIISRGAMKISAEEIEDLLRQHPGVDDVAVVGMPDPVLGERSCAYVVVRAGCSLSLPDAVAFLETKKLATFKLPERLETVAELPFSAGFKVQKNVLREDIARKLADEQASHDRSTRT